MQYIGVQLSTRAQLVLALGSMLIIGGFAIYIILEGRRERELDPAVRSERVDGGAGSSTACSTP